MQESYWPRSVSTLLVTNTSAKTLDGGAPLDDLGNDPWPIRKSSTLEQVF